MCSFIRPPERYLRSYILLVIFSTRNLQALLPITVKLCDTIGNWFNFINQVQNNFFWGGGGALSPLPKKVDQKHAKFGSILYMFTF